MKSLFRVALLTLAVALATTAHAGQSCEPADTAPWRMQRGLALSGQLQQALDARPDRVAVIARVGSDVSRYGLAYTHAALVVRGDDGAWTVVHKLNVCGSEQGTLYRQGLGNFFLDNPYAYRAKIVWLKPEIAKRLHTAAMDQGRLREVDQPRYSLLAYPFATQYQNSNGWLIEFIAANAVPPQLYTRSAAQRRLRDTHYDPDTIPVGTAERLGASFTRANVSFLDHPLRHRLAGEYETVTVESLVRWLDRQGWVAGQAELRD